MELLIKKRACMTFFEMGARTEKGHFGLGCGHQVQPRNQIKYFIILTKQ